MLMRPNGAVKSAAIAILIPTFVAFAGTLAIRFLPAAIESLLARINPRPDGE